MTVTVDVQVRVVVKGTYDPGHYPKPFSRREAEPDEFAVEGYYDEDGQAINEALLPLLHVEGKSFWARTIYAAREEYAKGIAESKGWEEDHPHRRDE